MVFLGPRYHREKKVSAARWPLDMDAWCAERHVAPALTGFPIEAVRELQDRRAGRLGQFGIQRLAQAPRVEGLARLAGQGRRPAHDATRDVAVCVRLPYGANLAHVFGRRNSRAFSARLPRTTTHSSQSGTRLGVMLKSMTSSTRCVAALPQP